VRIIDSHQHTNWQGKRTPELVAYLDRSGVDKAWLLSWESLDGGREPHYLHLSIDDVFDAAAQYPDRFLVGAGPDPRRENAPELLQRYHRDGARVYGEIKLRVLMDTPELILMFRWAGRLGMPVVFHVDLPVCRGDRVGLWYLGEPDAVERALAKCPETNFVAHGPGWWAHISGDRKGYEAVYPDGPVVSGGQVIRLLEKHPNLYCDLSGTSGFNALTRDPGFGRRFLLDFQDRLLYGADQFDTRVLDHLRTLDLPGEACGKILAGNALKLVPA